MLVLSRRISESVKIGNDVTVTVLGFKGNQVRLGIDAPVEIPVHREEIYQKVQLDEKSRLIYAEEFLKEHGESIDRAEELVSLSLEHKLSFHNAWTYYMHKENQYAEQI